MADEIKLNVEIRKDLAGHVTKLLRNEGKVPAVLYGPDIETIPLSIDVKEFKQAISTEQGENVLISIKAGTKKAVTTVIKEIQADPLDMRILHVDFCQIDLKEELELEIPVEVDGEAPGVKSEGGVLDHIVRTVHVRCLPTDIPDKFVIDVSALNVGDGLKVQDLPSIKNVEILTDPETLIVNVVHATELKEPEADELLTDEESSEPQVIGEAKAEESEESSETKE